MADDEVVIKITVDDSELDEARTKIQDAEQEEDFIKKVATSDIGTKEAGSKMVPQRFSSFNYSKGKMATYTCFFRSNK